MEPVVFVEIAGDARAYPVQVLMWHEFVNTRVGDVPLVVTFCPLCNAAIAYPCDTLKNARVVNSSVGGQAIVALWQAGTTSPFSGDQIAGGADVGSASAFSRVVGGRRLTFRLDGARIVDAETGSAWNSLGRAIDGPLTGQSLTPVVGVDHFWFSWVVFNPDTTVYTP